MSYKIIKLEKSGELNGYITYDAKNNTFNSGEDIGDSVSFEQIPHSKNENAYYYKVRGINKYMDVKISNHSKIKGNNLKRGFFGAAAWIMLGDKLSTYQGNMIMNRFLSPSNNGDTSKQLYANLSGEHCIVTIEDIEEVEKK